MREAHSSGWPEIRKRVRSAAALAVFLDYDGTLTPIVSHPSKARLTASGRRLLRELNRRPGIWVALVSGRSLKDLRRMAGVEGLCYVGNHGLEAAGPKIRYVNPMARSSRPVMKKIAVALREGLRKIPGAWVEDKGLTLSAHYRQVEPRKKPLVRSIFHDTVRSYAERKQVRLTAGKEVFEVRPPVRWTKGTVVNWLLARRTVLSCEPVLPIYIGDDRTDEEAFQAIGRRGITVIVGSGHPLTRAEYRVGSPAEAVRLLRRLSREWELRAERSADRAGRGDQRGVRRHATRSS